ncbi:hypothetical protein [Pseudovibrio sp. WM33]|uniref:hypothetical protein n=1 Tax=Pseudovibrio sp. WM33 TaxID=1735585 RepID=UPI0023AA5FC4|nr:hypothetical protein [Pseudovibrio sp. WM33]
MIAEIARGNEGHHRTSYSLTLLPSLHRLAHGSDCRIFQKKKRARDRQNPAQGARRRGCEVGSD